MTRSWLLYTGPVFLLVPGTLALACSGNGGGEAAGAGANASTGDPSGTAGASAGSGAGGRGGGGGGGDTGGGCVFDPALVQAGNLTYEGAFRVPSGQFGSDR